MKKKVSGNIDGRTKEEIAADLDRTRARIDSTLDTLQRKLRPSRLAGDAVKRVANQSVRRVQALAASEAVSATIAEATRIARSTSRRVAGLPANAEDHVERVGRVVGEIAARVRAGARTPAGRNAARIGAGVGASVVAAALGAAAVKVVNAAITGESPKPGRTSAATRTRKKTKRKAAKMLGAKAARAASVRRRGV